MSDDTLQGWLKTNPIADRTRSGTRVFSADNGDVPMVKTATGFSEVLGHTPRTSGVVVQSGPSQGRASPNYNSPLFDPDDVEFGYD
jgi:hypothetical protein